MTSADGPPVGPGEIEIQAAAHPANIASVRLLAADLAARYDYDVDEISDLRMAVDEACSELVEIAATDAVLSCRFQVTGPDFAVTIRTTPRDGAALSDRTFGWHVLSTLVDEVDRVQAGELVGIRLCKRGTEGRGD